MNPKKLLLAEDDADDQELFITFLGHRNDIIVMEVAENGFELLKSLEKISTPDGLPDLIVLDQNMPKKNGLQTLRFLKESNRYNHIPVLMYSTYTDNELIKNSASLGASLVMSKPVTKDGYDKMIDAFLEAVA